MTESATVTRSATVNGVDIAYIAEGEGQPIVLVHGGSGDLRTWERQLARFGAGHRAIALSCRGYWPNRTLEPDERIELATLVEDLAAFIRALDAGPVHFVGHSSPGGFGGLLLGSRFPDLLRSLVLLEPPAFPLLGINIPPTPSQLLRLLLRNPRAGAGMIRFGARGMAPAVKAFERGDDAEGLRIFIAANTSAEAVASLPRERFERLLENVGPLKAQIAAGFPEFSDADARSVDVPTLLVSGTRSPAHITAVTDRLEALIPDAGRLDISGATHNMFDSHPTEFTTGVLDFIGSRSG